MPESDDSGIFLFSAAFVWKIASDEPLLRLMKKLFLVAGEISGDSHGSALLEALPGEGFCLLGLGGPKMHNISSQIENWLDQAAVLGLWEVLKKYGYFKAKMEETVARIDAEKPDGVVLIDYPGFNLRLAKRLRDEGYTGKLIYYISPQVWAWKKGRVKVMAELLDLMICIFPFEKELYESSGLETVFCGHPLVDSLAEIKSADIEREANLVALLPGSREREVVKLFPPMLDAAEILLEEHSGLKFVTTGATPALTEKLRGMVDERSLGGSIDVLESSGQEIMRRAQVGVVASGTATLEAAVLGLPYCLVYKVAWLTAFAARRVLKVRFLGIVNVIAGREVVKELLQDKARGEDMAKQLSALLDDRDKRNQLIEDLDKVVRGLGGGGAHKNAADAVVKALSET
ncbi:MAG: lipid-A-disaccharide synthase [Verrucomicrobiales bacterium]|nr:lipid-A-disaccharide synthase [Verrucomicrobiales bacterium]